MEYVNKRICKKCLLQDIAPEEYLKSMKSYLDRLDDEVKTGESLYQKRIGLCLECDYLAEGICKICGCFVEYRAAIKLRGCPAIHPKW
ncbi:MAG TPA: hypothetical protein DEG06_09050 [Lachnospiraceae bacterium]|jgi:hypothetical protein|nr:hypothetical protein [Lachnospiraceae bacterium]HBY72372.1 hypothetical protein [Lachnospiraceae bacterium]HCA70405.1 hypothetical protein [Lachnospiraceae bacterium]HCR41161.1 hypothetical protein [Lachnospiraceae bacterium]